jgi:hypothetical protein
MAYGVWVNDNAGRNKQLRESLLGKDKSNEL